MKLLNSYFYYHLNFDFVLAMYENKLGTSFLNDQNYPFSFTKVLRQGIFFPAVFKLRHTKVASLKFPAANFNCDLYQIFF